MTAIQEQYTNKFLNPRFSWFTQTEENLLIKKISKLFIQFNQFVHQSWSLFLCNKWLWDNILLWMKCWSTVDYPHCLKNSLVIWYSKFNFDFPFHVNVMCKPMTFNVNSIAFFFLFVIIFLSSLKQRSNKVTSIAEIFQFSGV